MEPITSDGYGFFPPSSAQYSEVMQNCAGRFQVQPRPFWMATSFGVGRDYSRYLSNVIFMENSKDPWHVGTTTIDDVGGLGGSVTRVVAEGGAHHQDLRFSSEWDAEAVHEARRYERATVRGWLGRSPVPQVRL